MNMMAHKAKIVENNTFKLNVFVCLAGDTIINTDMGSTTIAEFEKHFGQCKHIMPAAIVRCH